jgi:bacteriocin biosynthesis cyclodehydratase domain-containing protein
VTGPAPELKPWYRIAESPAGVTLRYGASALLFEGAAARTLLPRLLPLLDGTRTADDLAAELGPPVRPAVDHALDLLAGRGLLRRRAPADDREDRARTVELLAATDPGARSPEELRDALGEATVSVLGDGSLAGDVGRLLLRAGVGAVERGWAADLVVAAPAPDDAGRLEEWNAEALAHGVPWLQLVPFDGSIAAVGPLFVPGETACHACFRLRRAVDGTAAGERQLRAHHLSSPALDAAVAGLAASVAVQWLATHDSAAAGCLLALEPEPHLSLTRHAVYRVPRCPACSPLARTASLSPWGAEDPVAA